MKRRDPVQIGELIRLTVENAGIAERFDNQKVCYLWSEVVGPTINRLTTRRWVSHDELHVVIASGPLKTELAYMSENLVKRLNEIVGHHVISKIIIH